MADNITTSDRIERLLKDLGLVTEKTDVSKLVKGLMDIVKRISYPEAFCPKCDENMFLKDEEMVCINCGYKNKPKDALPIKPKAILPPQVENAIKQINQKPSSMAEQIKKLREKQNPVSEVDKQMLKNDPGVPDASKANWV